MSDIINNAITQHIDENGKCRILNFKYVSLSAYPLPVLNIPEVSKSQTIFATLSDAINFVKKSSLEITQKDVDPHTGLLKGLWVKSAQKPQTFSSGYIPTQEENGFDESLKDIEESPEWCVDPIFIEDRSYIHEARANEKVASMLKEYALYEWSKNPAKFSENNFVVYEGRTADDYHISATENKQSFSFKNKNSYFYDRSRLIVPDKDTVSALLSYVTVSALNDSHLQTTYKNKLTVDPAAFYKTIEDFRPAKDQHIFIGKGSLVSWLAHHQQNSSSNSSYNQTETNIVFSYPLPHMKSPYYYRNIHIHEGQLVIIQNTRTGDFLSALSVSKEWTLSGVNLGYDIRNYAGIRIEDNYQFEVYTTDGMTHKTHKPKQTHTYTIFGYDDGMYAAILML